MTNDNTLILCKVMGCKHIDETNDWRKVMGLWVCKYHMKKMLLDNHEK